MNHIAIKDSPQQLLEEKVHCAARTYIVAHLGEAFEVVSASSLDKLNCWKFDIHRRFPDLDEPILAGRINVDAVTGQVVPLTDDEIWTIQGRAETRVEHKRGRNPALGDDGLVLPYQAKIKASVYAGDHQVFMPVPTANPFSYEMSHPFGV